MAILIVVENPRDWPLDTPGVCGRRARLSHRPGLGRGPQRTGVQPAAPGPGHRSAAASRPCLLITCEHGGNRVPMAYEALFRGHADLLASHRGFDPGALTLARELARHFHAPLIYATASRLVVDLNRSLGHLRLYSLATRTLPRRERQAILTRHSLPYRLRVERWIEERIAAGQCVLHIASHSFTPVLAGEVRRADVGLLYDPARAGEKDFCLRWQNALRTRAPGLGSAATTPTPVARTG